MGLSRNFRTHKRFGREPYRQRRNKDADLAAFVQPRLDFQGMVPPTRLAVHAGDSITLECHAGGTPPPTIYWLKDGEKVIQGEGENGYWSSGPLKENDDKFQLGLSTTKSKLYLDCATKQDEGIYSCVAESPFKTITTETRVIVKESPNDIMETKCVKNKRRTGTPSRIYMWTGNRVELEGSDVELFCRTTGVPEPAVVWLGPSGQVISNGSQKKYQVLKNGDLFIKGISWLEDMGVFTCVTENPFGTDEAETFLYPTAAGF